MDHFYISQICVNCLRGKRVFRRDLDLYDNNGRLSVGTDRLHCFQFICNFCWRKTSLDFYKFSHPDLICHLKQLKRQYEEMKETLDRFNILFNNIKKQSYLP